MVYYTTHSWRNYDMWSQIEYWVKNEDKLADEESETRVYSLWEVIREVFHRDFADPARKLHSQCHRKC